VAERDLYLIRRIDDGTLRTLEAQSVRGAMRLFVAKYGPPIGETFAVKLRLGTEDWTYYSVTKRGIRQRT